MLLARQSLQLINQFNQNAFRITLNTQAIVVLAQILILTVDVNDILGFVIGRTRAIPLAYTPGANDDHQLALIHGKVAGDGTFRAAHTHITRHRAGVQSRNLWAMDIYRVGQFQKFLQHLGGHPSRTSARLHRNPCRMLD